MTIEEAYDYLTENGIATEDELNLVTGIAGYNFETLEEVLFYRTGEREFPGDEDENEEEE